MLKFIFARLGSFAIPGAGPILSALSIVWEMVKPILNPAVWPALLVIVGLAYWTGEHKGGKAADARCNAAAAAARIKALELDLRAEKEQRAREAADDAEMAAALKTTMEKVKAYEDQLAAQPDSCRLDDADLERLRDISGAGAHRR